MLTPREFPFLSSDYESAWQLRKEVLLDPFAIDHDAARTDDAVSLHMGLFDEFRCQACLFLVPRTNEQVQMRQVAVATPLQGKGLGRLLLEFADKVALSRSFTLMSAHARATAVPFYKRLGYSIRGGPFEQVGIQHHLVEKVLGR